MMSDDSQGRAQVTSHERTPDALRAVYSSRLNRVIDYIERNLDQSLSLEELADIANFSRYHFHRVFGAMVGETLSRFVLRMRVERAAAMLLVNPKSSITEIAIDCGFSSSATFARSFKDAFGMSGTQWRQQGACQVIETHRNIRKHFSKARKAHRISACYIDPQTTNPMWSYEMATKQGKLKATIEVKELPEHSVAYLRHVGPYGQTALVPRLFDKLRFWAAARGLIAEDTVHLLVPHDNPNITEQDKLRLSICMTVPRGTPVDGEIGMMEIPGGKFAVAHFEITPDRVAEAWNVVMGDWLPQSGYQPDDRLSYEMVLNKPGEYPHDLVFMDICVPVRPL
jgi:AraC family transcriptional regulator